MHYVSLFLYRLSIVAYSFLVWVFSFFLPKAKQLHKGRKNTFALLRAYQGKFSKTAWFHCASLGEYEQAKPIIEALKKQEPQTGIAVSFFSPSGYEIRKNDPLADVVFYLPSDSPGHASSVIAMLNPSVVFFVKYEFWYFFLKALYVRKIPVYLVAASFRNNQVFFKWYGGLYRQMLGFFTQIFTQNHHSYTLLKSIGIKNVTPGKDTRYDRVTENCRNPKKLPVIETFKQQHLLLIAGSSYEQEEQVIAADWQKRAQRMKLVIAPHHIDDARIRQIEKTFASFKTIRYSDAKEENVKDKEVLIINNIGLLSSAYQYADIAFIGGGFGTKGLHNTLEAATFGMPVLFGPNNHEKFPEAKELIDAGVGYMVKDADDFSGLMNDTLNDAHRENIAQKSRAFIAERVGATTQIMEAISQ